LVKILNEINDTSIINEIQNEYAKINNRWLSLHYNTFISLVLLGFMIECVLGLMLYSSGSVVITFTKFVVKYMMTPLFINLMFVIAGYFSMRSCRLNQKIKVYMISLLFVGVCFILYSVHIIYGSLYLIFTLPILLTVVYGDRLLTTITAFLSITLKIIAELFIVWDPDKIHPLGNITDITNFIVSIFILLAFYLVCIVVIHFEKEKNVASIHKEFERFQMRQRLITDDLTGIYNRTALRNAFGSMENDNENQYLFAMMDIDNFKALNDTRGHNEGDQCLREFGNILKKYASDDVIPFRFGGDEFCILFKNIRLNNAIEICKSIQTDLKESKINETVISVSVSVGISEYRKSMSATQLIQNTDAALYRSKNTKDSIYIFDSLAN